MATTKTGAILYEGPSQIDGQPIVVIATWGNGRKKSNNPKTGSMVQTYILRADIEPHDAQRTGDDISICGDCPHRPIHNKERGVKRCYVNVAIRGPLPAYRKWKRGGHTKATNDDLQWLRSQKVRIGSYGDPLAVPRYVWESVGIQRQNTGYSHQWRNCTEHKSSDFLMASVDSISEAIDAWAKGFRTFRIMAKGETPTDGEVLCPASKEAGFKTVCADCGLCSGNQSSAKSVAIYAH